MLRHTARAAFLLAALAARPSFADVTGPATVVDGDTIVVAGERVRLQGELCRILGDEVDQAAL
jgi:endonuclease YncB( thermonuclease family)